MDTSIVCEVCNAKNDILAPRCTQCQQLVRSDSEKLLILLKRFDRLGVPKKIEAELETTKATVSTLKAERDQLQRENYELSRRLQQLSSFEPEYEDKIQALEYQLQELQTHQSFAANLQMVTFVPAAQFKVVQSLPTHSAFQLDLGTLDGCRVVRKQLFRPDPDDAAAVKFKESIALLAKLGGGDGTIVSLLGTSGLDLAHTQIYLEHMEHGDLRRVLSTTPALPWPTRLRIALQVAKAVAHIHALDLVHQCISSPHVLVGADHTAKLTGLSQARERNATHTPHELRWVAPELHTDGAIAAASADIYSLGLVLVELDTREVPYAHMTDRRGKPVGDLTAVDLVRRARDGDPVLQHAFRDAPEWYRALALRCTALDPRRRPSAVDVVRLLGSHVHPELAPRSPLPPVALRVTVMSATSLLLAPEAAKPAPSVRVAIGGVAFETKAAAGGDPTWDESFAFSGTGLLDATLEAHVINGRDGQLGKVDVALAKVLDDLDELQSWTRWLPVHSRGDQHGYLVLRVEVQGDLEAYLSAYVQALPRLQDAADDDVAAAIGRAQAAHQTLKARRSIVRQGGGRLLP
ncbi:protein kinase [Achlya hypogyna]|uniref:Protein kinase n=1 Tax=Achlya hypogyna TaxID=1202772 RepID=A0A1V9ZA78_ACHHY|nr:protein kinase [Achlya hypogyna]